MENVFRIVVKRNRYRLDVSGNTMKMCSIMVRIWPMSDLLRIKSRLSR